MSAKTEKKLRAQIVAINKNRKNTYGWQMGFLFLNLLYIVKDITQLNALALSLYAIPIIIDLKNESFDNTLFRFFKIIVISINLGLVISLIALSFTGVVIDTKTHFEVVATSYWLSGVKLDKGIWLYVMILDLFIPLILRISIIDEKDTLIEEVIKGRKKEDSTC